MEKKSRGGGQPVRTYKAIEILSKQIIHEGLCDAIILKGSIGRGDDDEFSDVDMYLIVDETKIDQVMIKRRSYLESYKEIVYLSEANFGLQQLIAIFVDGLHVDLYVATQEQLLHTDPIKVYYDPKGIFVNYTWQRDEFSVDEIVRCFEETLYYFVEADSAYLRKNYAWTACIMDSSIANAAVLLRYSYDKIFTFLGLKKSIRLFQKNNICC